MTLPGRKVKAPSGKPQLASKPGDPLYATRFDQPGGIANRMKGSHMSTGRSKWTRCVRDVLHGVEDRTLEKRYPAPLLGLIRAMVKAAMDEGNPHMVRAQQLVYGYYEARKGKDEADAEAAARQEEIRLVFDMPKDVPLPIPDQEDERPGGNGAA